jgi:EamA domain-containing membrane protein RarD
MPQARWAGFFIVWISLVILVIDMLRHAKRSRTARAAELI